MHMEFPHNILKREKENGVPSFSGTGDVENITYPVSQRGCPFFRYVSSLARSLWIFGPAPRGAEGSAGGGGGTASAGPRRRGTDTARTHSYGLAIPASTRP